jgi:hypothetical protein
MTRVGFEPTISPFERAKTIHALDPAVTVIGSFGMTEVEFHTVSSAPYLYRINNNNNSIQFMFIYVQTAQIPITKLARELRKRQQTKKLTENVK